MHTTASDGHASIEEMAETARERGYDYVAITDHSATHGFGNDVQPDELLRQAEHIRGARAGRASGARRAPRPTSCPDGSLDYEDAVLEQLDWVSRACTRPSACPRRSRPSAWCAAMHHPLVDAIGHPTGRLIERREAYALDLDRVIAAARGDRHLPRDQRQPGSARPQRRLRQGGRGGRRHARDRLRRPLAAHAGQHALRGGHRAPGLAHAATQVANTRPWAELHACASAAG